jgi:hypothetical protein
MRRRVACLAVLALGLLALRMPGQFALPQLWAEDGKIFLAQQHNLGAAAVFQPYAGYYHLIPRATACLAAPFGLAAAPYLYFFTAILVQAGAVLVIYRSRLQLPCREVACLLPLLVPNGGEVYANLTNTIWFTGLCLLVLLAQPAPSRSSVCRWQEAGLLLVCGLNGPFVLILVPIFVFRLAGWWRRRDMRPLVAAYVLALSVQLLQLEAGGSLRSLTSHNPWEWLVAAGATYTGSLFAGEMLAPLLPDLLLLPVNLLLIAMFAWAWRQSPPLLRMQMPCLLAGAALVMGAAYSRVGWHPYNLDPFVGGRYFLIPFTATLLALTALLQTPLRRVAAGLVAMSIIGSLLAFSSPPREDLRWQAHVEIFEARKFPGDSYRIPIHPQWQVELRVDRDP